METINDRYRIVTYLGRGGMGDVCLVHDNFLGGSPLALKRVRRDKIEPRTAATLRKEFLSLSRLRHPNLVEVFDFGVDRQTGDLFYTAELIRGSTWLEAAAGLKPASPEGLEALFSVLAQVLRALEFVHSHGLIHCDVKPENLLVSAPDEARSPAPAVGTVKIIDFGLVKREGAPREEKILGTPYYVAPETILGSRVDRRSDLYSLGVVLYHVATGRPPFLGDSNLAILKSHVEKEPVPPQKVVPDLPRELNDLILRLLEKNPASRFQGALEILEHVNRAFGFSIPLETPETQRSYPRAAELTGREAERARLYATFLKASSVEPTFFQDLPNVIFGAEQIDLAVSSQHVSSPPGRLVLLRGETGLGKRRLLDDLRCVAQAAGAHVVTIDCGGESDAPAGGLESLLSELSRYPWTEWASGLPAHLQSALVLGDAHSGPLTPELEDGLHAATQEVAHALLASSCDQATLICISNLHLAGGVVLELAAHLVALASGGQMPSSKLLVAASVLDRGATHESDFQRFRDDPAIRNQVLEIRLDRLEELKVQLLLTRAFPGSLFPERFATRLMEESDGNLEAILTILDHFLERRKIARWGRGWELEGDYENEDFPGKARGRIQERLSRFPHAALRIAKAFACLGDGAPLPLAVELSSVSPKDVMPSMALLTEEKILEAREQGVKKDFFAFVHRNARSILYQAIPSGQLAAIHERAGTILEAQGGSPLDTARHYLLARNRQKSVQYGLPAARELAGRQAFDAAIKVHEDLLELLEASDEKLRTTIRRELAALRFQVGDYRGVLDLLGGLSSGRATDESRLARVDLARAHAKLGHYRQAASLLDGLLSIEENAMGEEVRRAASLARAEVCLWQGRLVDCLRICRRLLEEGDAGAPPGEDASLRLELHMLTAESLSMLRQPAEAATQCQSALRIVDGQHDPRSLALSLFCRGKYYTYRGQLAKALKQFRLCRMLQSESNAIESKADCLLELGRVYHLLGAYREARPILEEALGHYEKTGNLARYTASQELLADVTRLLGDVEACRVALQELLESSAHQRRGRIFVEALLGFAGHALDAGDLAGAERYLGEARAQVSEESGTCGGLLRALALSAELLYQKGSLGRALEEVRTGLVRARELGDFHFLARFLALEIYLLCKLGRTGRARRSIVMLVDIAKRHELASMEGWALLGKAMVLARERKANEAAQLFGSAREIFLDRGSDRDLVQLQLEHGLSCIESDDHEQAYLSLEEGLHAARGLGLAYMQSQFLLALGRFEAAIAGDSDLRISDRLIEAERIASDCGYPELLWRIQSELWRLSRRVGDEEACADWLRAARESLARVREEIPPDCREAYFGPWPAEEVDLVEAAHRQ